MEAKRAKRARKAKKNFLPFLPLLPFCFPPTLFLITRRHPIVALFSKPFEIGAQRIGKERDVARMHDQVRARLDPTQLVFNGAPVMHAYANLSRTGFGDDRLDGLFEPRMRVLFGHAQAAREVVRADLHRVNVRHGEDLIERCERRRANLGPFANVR